MDTFFDHKNVLPSCLVFEVGSKNKIDRVMNVDVSTSEIEVCSDPICVIDGEVVTEKRKFSAIYPIYAGIPFPCMFLCFP